MTKAPLHHRVQLIILLDALLILLMWWGIDRAFGAERPGAWVECPSDVARLCIVHDPDRPLVVITDYGGPVGTRLREVRALRDAGTRVVIKGSCFSACTLYLGLKNACVYPEATLGFHSARNAMTDQIDDFSRFLTRVMVNSYPASVREKLHYPLTVDVEYFRGAQLIPGVPRC